MPGRGDAAPVRQRTSTASSGAASSFTLSIGGSIRLNDLLNDDDDYGFAEEAIEASFVLGEEASGVPDEVSVEVEEYERHSSRALGEEKQADSAVSSGFAPPAMVELIEEHVPLEASTAPQTSRSSEAADEWPEKRSLGGASIGSSDSSSRSEANGERMTASASSTTTPGEGGVKEKSSGKIGQLLDRAKNKLTAKKNEKRSITPESSHDSSAASSGSVERRRNFAETKIIDSSHARMENLSEDLTTAESAKTSTDPPSPSLFSLVTGHLARLPFYNARLYSLGVLLALTVAWPGFISGLLWGAYISSVAFLFFFVSDKQEEKKVELEDLPDLLVEEVAEEALESESDRVVYKGWMNELRAAQKYSPATYHVNACRCVLVRLDATTLRISRPARAVLKHAFHEDPTLTLPQPTMTAQSIYDLTNATVSLRPRRLAKRRWWSRKYPIYIRLDGGDDSRIFKRERTPSFMKRSISMHPEPHGTASIPSSSSTVFDRAGLRASISMDDRRPSVFDDTETDTTEDEDDFSLSSSQAGGATNVLIDRRHSQSTSEVDKQSEGGAVGEKSQSLSSKRKGIFLFARAAREKERWFHLLREACARARLEAARASRASELRDSLSNRNQPGGSTGSAREFATGPNRPVPPPRRRAQSEFFSAASLPSSDSSIPSSTKDEEKKEEPPLSQPTQSSSTATRATAAAYDEYAKYRTNRGEFEKVMADAMRLLAMTATTPSTTTPVPTPNGVEKEKRPNQLKNKQQQQQEAAQQSGTVSVDLGSYRWKPGASPDANSDLVSAVNAIASRIFFDFCRDSFWCQQVKEKIQTKLATIHLPYFIEQLELSALDLGTAAPHIESVYAPTFDQWGLWVDFEVKYSGGIRLTLETRVNLLRLRTGEERQGADSEPSTPLLRPSGSTGQLSSSVSRRGATRYSDEDLPESPEDSPDEDFGSKTNQEGTTRERAGSKLVSLVERAAQTSIFQMAARHPKISKIMTELAETRLQLNVEIEQLEGTMTVNLPGPPSDRIWYAFRRPPRISIRAVPQVGDRSVDWTTVSDWIESRLRLLLEKNLVCPNMDDVIVPVMSGNELLHMGYNV